MMPVIHRGCPNCGGPITAERLARGLPCEKCMPNPPSGDAGVEEIYRILKSEGTLSGYRRLWLLEKEYEELEAFFSRATGSRLWSAQKAWAKRMVSQQSFSIVAPTGVGKTTLLMVYSLYRASQGGRVLYILPTESLVVQVAVRLEEMAERAGDPVSIVYYYGSMSGKRREEALRRLEEGDFDIAVVTTGFLQRRYEVLKKNMPYELVAVDDVDSLLRNSRNIDRVLVLLGFPEEAVEEAYRLVKLRLRLYRLLKEGKEEQVAQLNKELAEGEARLSSLTSSKPIGQLVIASATGRPSGVKHLVFRELLGFEVGGGSDYLRNVEDTYMLAEDPVASVVELVKKLGPGGLVFVSQIHGRQKALELLRRLEEAGVKAAKALTSSRRAVRLMREGKVDVIVGIASRYGKIVRGLDMPEKIWYTVFLGIPGRRIGLLHALQSPRRLVSALLYMSERGVSGAGEAAKKIVKLLNLVGSDALVQSALAGKVEATGPLAELVSLVTEWSAIAYRFFEEHVADGATVRVGGFTVSKVNGQLYHESPDLPTYIQGSGRASRLYRMVMTKGLSVIIDDSIERISVLADRMRFYTTNTLKPFDELDLEKVKDEAARTRRGIGRRVSVESILFVVESPTKARTIAWFWGRPARRRLGRLTVYETAVSDPETGKVYLITITSTKGHILDLAADEGLGIYGVLKENGEYRPVYASIKRCLRCGTTFTNTTGVCPRCGEKVAVLDSWDRLARIARLAYDVERVIIATDPDTEGEKIAYDVYLVVKPYNKNIERAEFHEVTPHAIMEALRSPRGISLRLVYAQFFRRIMDRWVGFTLSQHLWSVYGKRWYGAGRVQTPVLGWIIERYREWKESIGYIAYTRALGGSLRARFYTRDPEVAKKIRRADKHVVTILDMEERMEERSPPPPYTTDALLYDISSKLGLPAEYGMRILQELFEMGLITYHRTDSTRVSATGIGVAKSYLSKKGLEHEYYPRQWGEGGAHEAIRPTRPIDPDELEKLAAEGSLPVQGMLTYWHIRVYTLIFNRFIASQMRPSKARVVTLKLSLDGLLESEIETLAWWDGGYLSILKGDPPTGLASLKPGMKIEADVKVIRTGLIPLYRSGDLVVLMKAHGIGRPSTYASAIAANKRHGYVIESKKRRYLIPTKNGVTVYAYLAQNFPELVSVETSRHMEHTMELIEEGRLDPDKAIRSLEELITGMPHLHPVFPTTGEEGVAGGLPG